jgi:CBS domain-containing protein
MKKENFKIQDLESANSDVIGVRPDSKLDEAITKMMVNDFSQLPVMSDEKTIDGIISWRTIGIAKNFNSQKESVKDHMVRGAVLLNSTDNFLDSVQKILEKEFAFVRSVEGRICGIITLYDIALQFRFVAEPFIELQHIETSIRRLIDARIENSTFLHFCNERYGSTKIRSTRDLTFGQYLNILGNEQMWHHLNLNLDRKVFTDKLHCVRVIRNEVMHFRTKEMSKQNLKHLKDVSKFFRMMERLGS